MHNVPLYANQLYNIVDPTHKISFNTTVPFLRSKQFLKNKLSPTSTT